MQGIIDPYKIIRDAEQLACCLNAEQTRPITKFKITLDFLTERCCDVLLAKDGESLSHALALDRNSFAQTIGYLIDWLGGDFKHALPLEMITEPFAYILAATERIEQRNPSENAHLLRTAFVETFKRWLLHNYDPALDTDQNDFRRKIYFSDFARYKGLLIDRLAATAKETLALPAWNESGVLSKATSSLTMHIGETFRDIHLFDDKQRISLWNCPPLTVSAAKVWPILDELILAHWQSSPSKILKVRVESSWFKLLTTSDLKKLKTFIHRETCAEVGLARSRNRRYTGNYYLCAPTR